MFVGMVEGFDVVQGFWVVVEQQYVQWCCQCGCGWCWQVLVVGDFCCLVQGEGYFLGILGFGQVVEDVIVVECVDGGIEVGIVGEENLQGFWIVFVSLCQQFGVVYLWYVLVVDQYLYLFCFQVFQGVLWVVFGEYFVMVVELYGQVVQDVFFVIDEENVDGRWVYVRCFVLVCGFVFVVG